MKIRCQCPWQQTEAYFEIDIEVREAHSLSSDRSGFTSDSVRISLKRASRTAHYHTKMFAGIVLTVIYRSLPGLKNVDIKLTQRCSVNGWKFEDQPHLLHMREKPSGCPNKTILNYCSTFWSRRPAKNKIETSANFFEELVTVERAEQFWKNISALYSLHFDEMDRGVKCYVNNVLCTWNLEISERKEKIHLPYRTMICWASFSPASKTLTLHSAATWKTR